MAIRRHTLDAYGTELYLVTNGREWKKLRKDLGFLDKGKPQSAGLSSFAIFEPRGGGVAESHLAVLAGWLTRWIVEGAQ